LSSDDRVRSGGDHGVFWALAILALVYAGLVAAYHRAVPLFEAPDEQSHLHYVAFVSREHRLPRTVPDPEVPGEGMQPPLYYVLLAPLFHAMDPGDSDLLDDLKRASSWVYGPGDPQALPSRARLRPAAAADQPRRFAPDPGLDALRALRWGTLPFGLLTLLLTCAGAWRLSRNAGFTLLTGSIVAFDPQFVFVSSYVSNDAACASVGAGALCLMGDVLDRDCVARRHYVVAALLVGLGAWIKNSTLPVLAVTWVALLALDSRPLRTRWVDAGIALAIAALLLAPHAASNLDRSGDPFGLDALWASAEDLPRPEDYGGLGAYLSQMYFLLTFRSYWGVFGWMDVFAPTAVYLPFFALSAAGLVGFALLLKDEGSLLDRRSRWIGRYVAAASLATLAMHLWLNTRLIQPQGRHLFAAAPHFATLLAMGIGTLTGGRPLRITWPAAAAIGGCLVALALYCLCGVVAPAYR